MWQLAWMLSFIPDAFWTFLLFGSLVAFAGTYILKFIPPFALYASVIRPVSLIIAFLAVYWQGGIDNEYKWQAKVKEMEEKVAAAEVASTEANKTIEQKVVTKTKIVKEQGLTIYQYIDREVVKDKEVIKFVENCPIPPAIVNTLNAAAKNQPIEEKK